VQPIMTMKIVSVMFHVFTTLIRSSSYTHHHLWREVCSYDDMDADFL
jgi:hypothetical protein